MLLIKYLLLIAGIVACVVLAFQNRLLETVSVALVVLLANELIDFTMFLMTNQRRGGR